MKDFKLCLIGGGGVRSPFVAKSIAYASSELNLKTVVLLDTDVFKLQKYGGLAKEIAKRINPQLDFLLETDASKALLDCDYIITTVRVGGDESRIWDEEIISNYGLLAQETTGAGGFSMAMRSIPVISEYCRIAREIAAPDHIILNFTNPAGIVTQALADQGFPAYGICDSPIELINQLARLMEVPNSRFSCNSFGLNHLTWFNNFKINGKDITESILNDPDLFTKTEMRIFDKNILELTDNFLPNEYLYFYYCNQKAIKMSAKAPISRAHLIQNVNLTMNLQLENLDPKQDFEVALKIFFDNYNIRENTYLQNESGRQRGEIRTTPSADEYISSPDEGGYAGVALNFLKALQSNSTQEMVLSTKNLGAMQELRPEDVVEIMCTVGNGHVVPRKQRDIPAFILNLILTMKEYERLSVKAILNKDKVSALRALTINPLVANLDIASNLLEEFIIQNKSYTGIWK